MVERRVVVSTVVTIVVSMGVAFHARLGSGTSVKIKKSIRDLLHWKDEGFSFFILFCYDAVRV